MKSITAWYMHGISSGEMPESIDALSKVAQRTTFDAKTMLKADKWDYLIREGLQKTRDGFVPLRAMATTKRGIATGANEFFHITPMAADQVGLPSSALLRCVGRAADVSGFEFTDADFASLALKNKRVHLVTLGKSHTESEQAYIALGEESGIQHRYLLAVRKPWYSMERQEPAPIWAAVFGRRGLRFVRNRAGALTLTTFHCVYPFDRSEAFAAALTLCLNLPSIQAQSRAHTRVYGGGLLKFEPNDLLEISVPDLRRISTDSVQRLAHEQVRISSECRRHSEDKIDWSVAEQLVTEASAEAAKSVLLKAPGEMHLSQNSPHPLLAERKRHGDRGESHDALPEKSESPRKSPRGTPTLWEL